jgi:hypothetical protein
LDNDDDIVGVEFVSLASIAVVVEDRSTDALGSCNDDIIVVVTVVEEGEVSRSIAEISSLATWVGVGGVGEVDTSS